MELRVVSSVAGAMILTVRSHSYDGDQQNAAQCSQADGGQAVEPGAARSHGQSDWGAGMSWRRAFKIQFFNLKVDVSVSNKMMISY